MRGNDRYAAHCNGRRVAGQVIDQPKDDQHNYNNREMFGDD